MRSPLPPYQVTETKQELVIQTATRIISRVLIPEKARVLLSRKELRGFPASTKDSI